MDFSKFEGFVDWNFAIGQMPSIEEQEERKRQALHDRMRTMGVEPLSNPRRLLELLEQFQDTVLQSDDISGSMVEHQSGGLRALLNLEHELSCPLSENTLFRGLLSLAGAFLRTILGNIEALLSTLNRTIRSRIRAMMLSLPLYSYRYLSGNFKQK